MLSRLEARSETGNCAMTITTCQYEAPHFNLELIVDIPHPFLGTTAGGRADLRATRRGDPIVPSQSSSTMGMYCT